MAILIKKNVRVVVTGGGTGGHMYPLLAVADWLRDAGEGAIEVVFFGSTGRYYQEFRDRYMKVYDIAPAKLRRYFDMRNFIDFPLFLVSLVQAFFWMYIVMPEVVFSKGGSASLPVVLAARFYKIPIMVHESDATPSLTTVISAKSADRIGVTFPDTLSTFPPEKALLTGNPLRADIMPGGWLDPVGGKSYFGFDPDLPLLLVLGGSQGSVRINDFIFDNLVELLGETQILHQVGVRNEGDARGMQKQVLKGAVEVRDRYVLRAGLDAKGMKLALSAADIVFSRAGSGAIAEIAAYGKPSILIPLREAAGDHQRMNAYAYSETGACVVLEEENLAPHVFLNEIKKLLAAPVRMKQMGEAALAFAKPNATEVVGREVLKLAGVDLN